MVSRRLLDEQEKFRRLRIAELGSALDHPANKSIKQNLTVAPHRRPLRVHGTLLSRPPLNEELDDPQIVSLLGIPPLYRGAKWRPWHPACDGYYWGDSRKGKTWRAVGFLKGALVLTARKNGPPLPKDDRYDWYEYERHASFAFHGHYVSIQKWFSKVYSAFENAPDTVEGLQASLVEPDYLVLDDLGAMKTTEWVVSTLEGVLDQRISDRKPTIVTGNLPPEKELVRLFKERLVSRLKEIGTHHVTKRVGD